MGRAEAGVPADEAVSAEAAAAQSMIRVEVAWSPGPRAVDVVALALPAGATAADALQASGLVSRHGLDAAALRLGVWCRACEPTAVLRDRDRVEVYRPLRVDPKEARRLRYRQHLEKKSRSG